MIRMYYSLTDEGLVLKSCDKEAILVRDGVWYNHPILSTHVERIELYSFKRYMTTHEMLNDSIRRRVEFNHPWEGFGTVPVSEGDRLKEHLERFPIYWWESQLPQAFDSFNVVYAETLALEDRILCICDDGPYKGDAVNVIGRETRVLVGGTAIYERRRHGTLLNYVRDHAWGESSCLV